MSGAVSDLRIIEISHGPGELAGKLLADMGADLIKIEPPDGAESRRVGPFADDVEGPNRSLHFWYHNTNKRSVTIDFASDEGKSTVLELCRSADVLIEDFPPGRLARMVASPDELRVANRGLIICSLTAFGQTGPWADWRSSDLVSLAAGGPMAMNGYSPEDAAGAPPIRGHGDQAHNTACHYAVIGVLLALLHRDRTGEGQLVDCSIHEALSCTVEVGMPYYLYERRDVVRQTSRHAASIRTEPWLFRARDGRDVILFGRGRDNASWGELKRWIQSKGFGPQLDEARFDDPRARQPGLGSKEAAEITAELEKFIAASTADEIYRGGQERRQAWGTVRAPDETVADPHLDDRGFFVAVNGEGRGEPVLMPGAPYIFSATPWELRRPAPRLGEHTAEVLRELRQL